MAEIKDKPYFFNLWKNFLFENYSQSDNFANSGYFQIPNALVLACSFYIWIAQMNNQPLIFFLY